MHVACHVSCIPEKNTNNLHLNFEFKFSFCNRKINSFQLTRKHKCVRFVRRWHAIIPLCSSRANAWRRLCALALGWMRYAILECHSSRIPLILHDKGNPLGYFCIRSTVSCRLSLDLELRFKYYAHSTAVRMRYETSKVEHAYLPFSKNHVLGWSP